MDQYAIYAKIGTDLRLIMVVNSQEEAERLTKDDKRPYVISKVLFWDPSKKRSKR